MYFVYLYVKPVKRAKRMNERIKSPEQHGEKSCTIRKENQFPLSK